MTETTKEPRGFARESSRIGMNLGALVASRVLCLGLSLVQASIILSALGVERYGTFTYAQGFAGMWTVFATLGVQRLLVRDIARNPGLAATYLWTAEAVVAFLSALVIGAAALSVWFVEPNPEVRRTVLLAASWVVALWALQRPFEAILVARERMVLLAFVNIAGGISRLAAVYAIMRLAPRAWAAHGAMAVGNLAAFALCAALALAITRGGRPRVRLSLAFHQIRECIPFSLAMLFSLVYFRSDVVILGLLAGNTAAGIYGPVQRLVEPIVMIAGLWGTAVFPALCRFSVDSPENYARLKKTSIRLALMAALPMAFGLAAVAGPVVALLTRDRFEEFAASVPVLRVMCVFIPFFYLNGVGQEFFYAAHRNYFVVACYAAAGVVSVTCNILLIPVLGVAAVAYTAIVANALISVAFVFGMRKEFGAMGLLPLVAKTVAACAAMGCVAYRLAPVSLVASIAVGAAIYVVLQFALRTLTREELRLLSTMAAALFRRGAPVRGAE